MISYTFERVVGEITNYSVSWLAYVTSLSTSVSTAVWAVESGTSVTIDSDSLSDDVTVATITQGSAGCSVIKVTATFADGEVDIFYFQIRVSEIT